jgi:hypothetical protein
VLVAVVATAAVAADAPGTARGSRAAERDALLG